MEQHVERPAVLVADDDPGCREVFAIAFEHAGFGVVTCANGREAIERSACDGAAYDAFILDLDMPELDGRATAEQLRCDVRWQQTPIICVSANPTAVDQLGPWSTALRKPTSPRDVVKLVQRFLASGPRPRETNEPT